MENKNRLSALMDAELDSAERERLIDLLLAEPDLAEEWGRWEAARAAMHHDAPLPAGDLVSRVSAALKDEPTVLAPRVRSTPVISRYVAGGAIAASFVLGLVMAGLGMRGAPDAAPAASMTALQESAMTRPAVELVAAGKPDSKGQASRKSVTEKQRMDAYLMAHAESVRQGVKGMLAYAPVAALDDEPDEVAYLDGLDSDALMPVSLE